jgi:UDP-N-acetylmuramyl pentapeptide phosphotransferase/UDP-N-acetylglucosamine-1-phosphate transferase
MIWLTNAFNFMDGADALAGLQAVVAGAGWIILGLWTGDAFIAAAATLIVGATAGFLRYNWPPARVFMGDVGSAFLGYSFAALTVRGWAAHSPLAIAGVLVLWPFVFDAAFTLARRVRRGERVWEAHRTHLYQRSISHGAGHADVAIEYALAASIGVLTAVAWVASVDPQGAIVVAVAAGSALWLWVRMTARERRGQEPVVPHA